MKDANSFAEASCYCSRPIPIEFLRKNYETKWSQLQMREIGLALPVPRPHLPKKYKCCKCEKDLILDDLREMHCYHRYCVNCLKELMEESINGNKEKLKCVICSEKLDNDVLKYVDMDLHKRYTSALSESS